MQRVVIFTIGFHARATFRYLARQTDCRVVGFVDNNPAAQGTMLFGLPVLAPQALPELDFDLVAVPGRNQAAITAQLRDELRVESDRIWSVNKSEVPPAPDELERRGADLGRLLRQAVSVIETLGMDYWAMHSGLLGLLRGQELALFSDLDLCVTADGFKRLADRLQHDGFEVTARRSADDAVLTEICLKQTPVRPWDEPAMIDLHPLALGPTEATWLVNHKPLSLAAGFFHGCAYASYRNMPVRVPLDAAAVLTELYGPDWRRPAETWNGHYAFSVPSAAMR